MNDLEPGCLAIIMQSVLGLSVGKIVQCVKVIGVHSLHGVVWRVRAKENLATEYGGLGPEADMPAKWLKKIKPDTVNDKEKVKEIVET